MDSNCDVEGLSVSMQSCEPFSMTGTSCAIEPDVEDTSLVAVIDTSPVLRGDKDKDNVACNYAPEIPGPDMTCLDSRKNARKGKVNQNARKNKATRKCERLATKQTHLNTVLQNVERRRRTNLCKTGRSSSWGSLGNIAQLLVQNLPADVVEKKHTKSQRGKSAQDSKNKAKDGKSSKFSKQNNYTSTGRPIRLKVKLGNEPVGSCPAQSVEENAKQNCLVQNMEIPELKELCKGSILKMPVMVHSCNHQCTHSQIEGEALRVAADNQYLDPGTSPDSEVINLISDTQVDGKAEEVTRHAKISSKASAALGDVRDLHLPELIGKDGNNPVMLHQEDNCCMDDRLPSPEITDNIILLEKHEKGGSGDIYNGEGCSKELLSSSLLMESRGSGEVKNCRGGSETTRSGGHDKGFESPDSSVPKKLLVYAKGHKKSKNSKSRIVGKSMLEVTNSLDKQKGKTSKLKGKNGKPVSKKKSKEEGAHGQDVSKIENDHETGNKLDNLPSVKRRIGNSTEGVLKSGMMSPHASELQFPSPRIAWVCCDDCLKWRRIAATLADSIEETDCRWTCKDNMDKEYADCSVPQEKSNDDINEELEISDASCGEDPCNTYSNSRKLDHKQSPQDASWTLIKSNLFLHRSRKSQTIDEIMVCHCKSSPDGRKGCGDGCLNRMLNIECVQGTCPCGELCSNQKFQKRSYAKLKWFRCGKKGYGLQVVQDIRIGQFLIEYVGEVLDVHAYEARQREYASMGHKHFYFMTLNGSEVIDACAKGNLGRFINHSCEPNCQTEKWMVNGEVCIGLFAVRDIKKGEELTFDYNYVRVFGAAAKRCVCGSSQCRGYIGGDRSNAEVIVQDDSDEEYPEPLMVYKENEIDDDLRNLLYAPSSLDDVETHAINSKLEVDAGRPKIIIDDSTTSILENLKMSEDKDEIHKSVSADESLEVMGMTNTSNALASGSQISSENSLEKSSESGQMSEVLLEQDKSQAITCNALPDFSGKKFSNHLDLTQSSDTSPLTKKGESSSETKVIVKKCKTHVKRSKAASNLQAKTKIPSSAVKKGKVKGVKNLDKPPMVDNKSHVLPCKTKKPISSSSNSRFEAVEEKLNELLDAVGGISKRRDSTKGYLKLLLLTAASGYCGSGEATIQSNRDLSMILDALLKTKSRMVLVDIINKNGLQMLHNIMKRYRKEFNKTPILRKLLKVLEYLAYRNILTTEHITGGPPRPGVESFRESILSFTEHDDKQVHQIARNFRDRWIPKTVRKISCANNGNDDLRLDHHHNQGTNCNRYSTRPDPPHNNNQKLLLPINPIDGVPCSTSCPTNAIRTRKRKSRWDEAPETMTNHEDPQNSRSMNIDVDAPPGFSLPECSDFIKVSLQKRFNSRLPVSYGIPLAVVQQFGFPQAERPISWVVAPGIPFQPFPPLPPISSLDKKEHPHCTYKASSSDLKIACGKRSQAFQQPMDFDSLKSGAQQNEKRHCQGL
ncbi:histone-lysine N-methyltransferase ASHH2-like isoform X2 [Impatiens glandulifera]|uniref:histone-lysine N-methyltransferase ASHH2-like isoform X2 n=1 Tax=Impatiens glandulifera TaxID=253017 RepID=UPI001FB161B1|nr:histone-lysine N-methyltransferase ASHH2-like isoform X2 [Impatiens glandulifera]